MTSLFTDVHFDGSWAGWREVARSALLNERAPDRVSFRSPSEVQESLFGARDSEVPIPPRVIAREQKPPLTVPRDFIALGTDVACHAEPARWSILYRVLWRLTHGEPHLLEVYVDPDVHDLQRMAKVVRREGHKLRAFVRFRRVGADTPSERFVAWFEPAHDVVAREAPFFARRFPEMKWSILTPSIAAHWDGERIEFAPGVLRDDAPAGDDLEVLWRTYYAHTFNPSRAKPKMMRSEMPVRYWKNLPEAVLIAPLLRDAPARMQRMIEQQRSAAQAAVGARALRAQSAPIGHPESCGPRHDEGVAHAIERSDRAQRLLATRGISVYDPIVAGRNVRVGTASWTDPTMTSAGVFYPDGVRSAEARLKHYASRYSLVEVDSTYYALPSRQISQLWVERTPASFVFDIKAHALMTGHSTSMARLPPDLREAMPSVLRARREVRTQDLPVELMEEVWRRFISALEPLLVAGKLGAVLLQLPRHCVPSSDAERMIVAFRQRAASVPCAVEFRHASWVDGSAQRQRTLDLMRAHDLAYVMVDAPPGFPTSMPPITAVTNEQLAIVRMHGRRIETWDRAVDVVSERYRYLYDAEELGGWVPRIIDVAHRTTGVHVVMNNCHANYGTSNADEISMLLVEADLERRRMSRQGHLIVD